MKIFGALWKKFGSVKWRWCKLLVIYTTLSYTHPSHTGNLLTNNSFTDSSFTHFHAQFFQKWSILHHLLSPFCFLRSVPLQPLFLTIGRSWLVGLSGPLIVRCLFGLNQPLGIKKTISPVKYSKSERDGYSYYQKSVVGEGLYSWGGRTVIEGDNTPKIGSSIAQDSGKKSALPKGGGIINPNYSLKWSIYQFNGKTIMMIVGWQWSWPEGELEHLKPRPAAPKCHSSNVMAGVGSEPRQQVFFWRSSH